MVRFALIVVFGFYVKFSVFICMNMYTDRAVNCFTASIQADPTYVRAYVCRAEAYQQMNKVHTRWLNSQGFSM